MNSDALRQGIVELLPRLRRYAYALTGAREDTEDLLHTTVERLLQKGIPDDAHLRKWAFRVCKNIWIDEIRARRVRSTAKASGKVGRMENVDGEQVALDKLTIAEVIEAMDNLPDDQRAALSLVVMDGVSYAEAAEVLEAPVGTVMSRIARARKALSKRLNATAASWSEKAEGAGAS